MSDKPENQSDDDPRKEPAKFTFSPPQLLGSAAAAATVAYLGSSLGTAGTIFGAALASVIGAIAGTVYTAGLDRTGRRLGSVMHRGWHRIRNADPELDQDLDQGEEQPAALSSPSGPEPPHDRGEVWRRVLVRTLGAAAAIFVVAFVAITAWELVSGRSLEGNEGTTVGQVVRPERPATSKPEPTPTESATPTHSAEPSATPTATPTATPSETVSGTPEPTPTETGAPTLTPTPTPTPTPASTPSGSTAESAPSTQS